MNRPDPRTMIRDEANSYIDYLERMLDEETETIGRGGPSLAAVREELERTRVDGTWCPACDQWVKIYKRKVNSSMARAMWNAYRSYRTEFGYLQDIRRKHGETDNREEPKLRYWGLMEEENRVREDGGRAGFWRVTAKGEQFLGRRIKIQKYAIVYNGECFRHEGDFVTFEDCLGEPFNLQELMDAQVRLAV